MTLLDKIKEFERVLKLLIKISRKRIDDGKPREFTSSVIGEELRIITIEKDRQPIVLVTDEYGGLLETYVREGVKKKYQELFYIL